MSNNQKWKVPDDKIADVAIEIIRRMKHLSGTDGDIPNKYLNAYSEVVECIINHNNSSVKSFGDE